MLAISGAIVALSAYSANADFITQADFDSTAVVSASWRWWCRRGEL